MNLLFAEQAAGQAAESQDIMGSSMNFMMIFNIFIAAYLLYYAIKGTGKVYENEYPKAMQESYMKFMRKFCWITGIGMLILSILEYINKSNSIFTVISIVYVLGCVVLYFILFRVKYKEFLKKSKPAK